MCVCLCIARAGSSRGPRIKVPTHATGKRGRVSALSDTQQDTERTALRRQTPRARRIAIRVTGQRSSHAPPHPPQRTETDRAQRPHRARAAARATSPPRGATQWRATRDCCPYRKQLVGPRSNMDATLYYRCTTQTICLHRRLHARRVEHHTARAGDRAGRQILAEAAAHKAVVAVRPADLAPDRAEFAPLDLLLGLVDVHHPVRGKRGGRAGEHPAQARNVAGGCRLGMVRNFVSASTSCHTQPRPPAAAAGQQRSASRQAPATATPSLHPPVHVQPLGWCRAQPLCPHRSCGGGAARRVACRLGRPARGACMLARIRQIKTCGHSAQRPIHSRHPVPHVPTSAPPLASVVEQQQARYSSPSSIRCRQRSQMVHGPGQHRGQAGAQRSGALLAKVELRVVLLVDVLDLDEGLVLVLVDLAPEQVCGERRSAAPVLAPHCVPTRGRGGAAGRGGVRTACSR